jgi:amino acid permease
MQKRVGRHFSETLIIIIIIIVIIIIIIIFGVQESRSKSILHNHLSQKRGKGEATFPMPVETNHDRFLSPTSLCFFSGEDLDLVTNLP